MHMNMDITRFLVEGREEQYLRHFFRDFAYNPNAVPEEEVQYYVMQMRQPGNLRGSLNHYGYIPQMAEQTKELTRNKLTVPMLAWGGRGPLAIIASTAPRRSPTPRKAASSRMRTLGLRREARLYTSADQLNGVLAATGTARVGRSVGKDQMVSPDAGRRPLALVTMTGSKTTAAAGDADPMSPDRAKTEAETAARGAGSGSRASTIPGSRSPRWTTR